MRLSLPVARTSALASIATLAFMSTVALGIAPRSVYAQANPTRIELGLDGGVAVRSGTGFTTSTDFELPVRNFRIGFFMSDNLSIEPFGSLSHFSGGGSSTTYELGVGALFLSGTHKETQYYVRPFAGLMGVSGTGIKSNTPLELGAALGTKIPMDDRLAARLEAGYERTMKSGDFAASNVLFVMVGFSFHTW